MSKWVYIILALIVGVAFGLAFVVTRIENYQFSKNSERKHEETANSSAGSTVAVIVFSRSGNTGVLANHIAQSENARIFEIYSDDYALGIPGWLNALKDARSNEATISPQIIDLGAYSKVYLGSPIWLYSPAPPIWQFVKQNEFKDKEVVLFNSFNSKFEQHFIDEFEALVRSKGAVSFIHRYVKRGRMGDQISTEEMLLEFDSGNNWSPEME